MTGNNQIEIYKSPKGDISFNVDPSGETIWATQAQISELFNTGLPTINHHLKSIFESGELDPNRTIRKNRIVRQEGKRQVTREI
ncbi:death-on-curing protein, partial [Candidatus Saccharibacteria bacterium]|nr:death-on-curing protein [Candidatus Saccharibacteria bacterium]